MRSILFPFLLVFLVNNNEKNGENGEKNSKYFKKSAENKKKGMLKLELTDGVNFVKAVELEDIFPENSMIPGMKIMLTGKVKCRRGTLLLDKSNCQILGGRVDSQKVDKLNILTKLLNIDLDGEKKKREEALLAAAAKLLNSEFSNINSSKNSKISTKTSKNTSKSEKLAQKSLNQSTISPFLVKTDRKTGEIKNPSKCSSSSTTTCSSTEKSKILEISENSEIQENLEEIQEIRPAQEPTPEPPEIRDYDPIDDDFSWNFGNSRKIPEKPEEISKISEKSVKKNLEIPKISENPKEAERSVENWKFNSISSSTNSFDNIPSTAKIPEKNVKKTEIYQWKPLKKQLPGQLLGNENPQENDDFEDSIVQTTFPEKPRIGKIPAVANIAKWEAMERKKLESELDRKGSEEEDFSENSRKIPQKIDKKLEKEGKKDESVMVIPSWFFDNKIRGNSEKSSKMEPQKSVLTAKTIHGPRGFDVKKMEKKKILNLDEEDKITDHFQTVKSPRNSSRTSTKSTPSKISAPKFQNFEKSGISEILNEDAEKSEDFLEKSFDEIVEETRDAEKLTEEEEEEERQIVESILAEMRQQNQLSTTRTTGSLSKISPEIGNFQKSPETFVKPIGFYENSEKFQKDAPEEEQNSILECTIEKEGRRELQKWGLSLSMDNDERGGRKRDADDEEDGIIQRFSKFHQQFGGISEHFGNFGHFQSNPHQFSTPPTNFHEIPRKMIKMEGIEVEDLEDLNYKSGKSMMIQREKRQKSGKIEEEIKNRQSENVQIYKTPFAKRIPSTDVSSSANEKIMKRLGDLNIIPLGDALINRKYWMMSKIIVIMPTICHQVHELKSDGIDWQLQIRVSDTSASDVICIASTQLLNRIFGFTVQQCKNLFNAKRFDELRSKKAEAERKLVGFKRLDLLIWIEISPEIDKIPMILDVKTISDALNIL